VPEFDERELKEIRLALFYAKHLAHGTAGHNRLMLLAKTAEAMGFLLDVEMKLRRYGDPFNVKIPPVTEVRKGIVMDGTGMAGVTGWHTIGRKGLTDDA